MRRIALLLIVIAATLAPLAAPQPVAAQTCNTYTLTTTGSYVGIVILNAASVTVNIGAALQIGYVLVQTDTGSSAQWGHGSITWLGGNANIELTYISSDSSSLATVTICNPVVVPPTATTPPTATSTSTPVYTPTPVPPGVCDTWTATELQPLGTATVTMQTGQLFWSLFNAVVVNVSGTEYYYDEAVLHTWPHASGAYVFRNTAENWITTLYRCNLPPTPTPTPVQVSPCAATIAINAAAHWSLYYWEMVPEGQIQSNNWSSTGHRTAPANSVPIPVGSPRVRVTSNMFVPTQWVVVVWEADGVEIVYGSVGNSASVTTPSSSLIYRVNRHPTATTVPVNAYVCVYREILTGTPTATATRTPTVATTATSTPTAPPLPTRTATATRTPTASTSPTVTSTPFTSPPPDLGCPNPTQYSFDDITAWSGQRVFVNQGQRIGLTIRVPPNTVQFLDFFRDIRPFDGVYNRLFPGVYSWPYDSDWYWFQPNGEPSQSYSPDAILWVCPFSQPTATPTLFATATPGGITLPTAVCLPIETQTIPVAYSMPDLSLEIPTLKPMPTAATTATTTLSTTAVIEFFGTIEAGIATPGVAIQTAVAGYSWQAGANLSATNVAMAGPALDWFAILNPQATAWTLEGGPLWALQPLLGPVLPIFIVLFAVLLVRFVLFVVGWLLKLFDVIIKLIELIPGE